ncbi:MAG: copper resistance protein NlpE N-terminal domain-containing protein [Sporocytophaga sp.]|uniref:copper resistance protein NlpE N-terminal domain-containing protein n=1 Tax=Sporocytophaga sp. TaxID=2231183 RepID=UPI001B02F074|nr:copper resistance protein NlpE N-terminal domain-containing protein [Sporocytophaga sp.]MBO9702191.1 copper resistance protein NlpE N-terminal domain-containing protein [Sporocytophaga sp.]
MKGNLVLLLIGFLLACHVEKKPNSEGLAEEDVIFEAKEIVPEPVREIYIGVLPCADCPGIRKELKLTHDPEKQEGDFELKQNYIERDTTTYLTKGYWKSTIGNEDSHSALLIQTYPEGQKKADNFLKITTEQLVDCGKKTTPPKDQYPYVLYKVKKPSVKLSGYFRYFADAATFRKCKAKTPMIVEPVILYKYAEQVYMHQKKNPGEEIYFTIEGYTEKKPGESGQTREYLTITKVLDIKPGFKCQ